MTAMIFEEAVAILPPCARDVVKPGLQIDGCSSEVACLCASDAFQTIINFDVAQTCGAAELDATLDALRPLCLEAVPSLNNSLQPVVLGITIALMILATVSVALRFFARRKSTAPFKVDDGLIVLALIFTYGLDAINFAALRYGYGRHTWVLSYADNTTFLKYDFAFQALFALAVTTIKTSILFFYDRIFPSRKFKFCAIGVGILNIVWCIIFIVGLVFSAKPTAFFWDHAIPRAKGVNEVPFGIGISVANVITDLLVLILPVPLLWRLQMKREKKLGITAIFLLGGFACVAGVLRIPFLVRSDHNDISYTVVSVAVWVSVETNIGIVCACLPTMRPLLRKSLTSLSLSKLRSIRRIFQRDSTSGTETAKLEKESSTGSVTLANSEQEAPKSILQSFESKKAKRSSRLTDLVRTNSQDGGELGLPANGQLHRLAHSSPWDSFKQNPIEEAGQRLP